MSNIKEFRQYVQDFVSTRLNPGTHKYNNIEYRFCFDLKDNFTLYCNVFVGAIFVGRINEGLGISEIEKRLDFLDNTEILDYLDQHVPGYAAKFSGDYLQVTKGKQHFLVDFNGDIELPARKVYFETLFREF